MLASISLELVSALAAVGTFVVIAVSAVAALVQLRHMRGSNQITALNELRETMHSPEMTEGLRFVIHDLPGRLGDPKEMAKALVLPFEGAYHSIELVGNVFEGMGSFVKHGLIDREIACDLWSYHAVLVWNALVPVVTYMRKEFNIPQLWETFEYIAALSRLYTQRYPNGSYPAGLPHMPEDTSLFDAVQQARKSAAAVGTRPDE